MSERFNIFGETPEQVIERLQKTNAALVAALTLIAAFKGKTLISASDESHEVGANKAFEQCSAIAADALAAAES